MVNVGKYTNCPIDPSWVLLFYSKHGSGDDIVSTAEFFPKKIGCFLVEDKPFTWSHFFPMLQGMGGWRGPLLFTDFCAAHLWLQDTRFAHGNLWSRVGVQNGAVIEGHGSRKKKVYRCWPDDPAVWFATNMVNSSLWLYEHSSYWFVLFVWNYFKHPVHYYSHSVYIHTYIYIYRHM